MCPSFIFLVLLWKVSSSLLESDAMGSNGFLFNLKGKDFEQVNMVNPRMKKYFRSINLLFPPII